MSNTVEIFEQQKKQAISLLTKLVSFVEQGKELGVEIHQDLVNKLTNALQNVEGEKLKVALVGGFSEGKTSIAAAWMGKLDKSTMKISHQESSNEVKRYDIDDQLQLIDTPGLYGYKEELNQTTQQIEKYKEITKRYVSEAHLVLYVMDSSNPIKDSHSDDLKWLFRELNLLPRTVFVLSRFDDIADVADDEEYQAKYTTKQAGVIQGLSRALELKPDEIQNLSIVAIAANPFDLGVDHWLENKDQFEQLSHIKLLQAATETKVQSNGGLLVLANEAKRSVVADIMHKQLPLAQMGYEQILIQSKRMADLCEEHTKELSNLERKINKSQFNMEARIVRHFEGLITQIDGLGMETSMAFFQREIGTEGVTLDINIRQIFEDEVGSVNNELTKIESKLHTETEQFGLFSKDMMKNGVSVLKDSAIINGDNILLVRDGFKSAASTIGLNLGKYIKFKPWGAVNLAKNINNVLPFIGIAIEVWDSWSQAQKQEEFRKSLERVKNDLNGQRKEIISLIKSDDFRTQFFPALGLLKEQLETLQQELHHASEQCKKFELWKAEGEVIEAEFREI